MSEYFEFIDDYFQKQLDSSEKQAFEKRCVTNEVFAADVALYISSHAALRELLLEEKKQEWSAYNDEQRLLSTQAPLRSINFRKWLPYAAAACLVAALLIYPIFSKDAPEKLAAKYSSGQLAIIGQTMAASRDTLQSGIAAYNKRDYKEAMVLFQGYYSAHPDDTYALQYIGRTHLMTGEYDQAIQTFERLATEKLQSNPGVFLQGTALLLRNQPGDKTKARALLQQVADEGLDGDKEATAWLENW